MPVRTFKDRQGNTIKLSVRKEPGTVPGDGWHVAYYCNGVYDEGKTYYALDRDDAEDTAAALERSIKGELAPAAGGVG